MVNYQSPVTIQEDYSAYAFLSGFRVSSPAYHSVFFNSGSREALSCLLWYIYVSHPVLPGFRAGPQALVLNRDPPLLAGNLSLTLTLSGILSEGVALTDGRYGFVAFFKKLFGGLLSPVLRPRIEYYLL